MVKVLPWVFQGPPGLDPHAAMRREIGTGPDLFGR